MSGLNPIIDKEFEQLLKLVREGNSDAAAELVRRYEPEIRRTIRVRLTDPRLRRVVDSMDVCQSVLANFFVRASAGQYDVETPSELIALLVTMVRNKVVDQARRFQAEKRDVRKVELDAEAALARATAREPKPDSLLANRELLAEVRQRLSADERHLAERRAAGSEWRELAAELGASPDALRKKLARALDRVAVELGLEE